jgi:hypothetical protein
MENMELEYTSWQDGDWYLGYLTEYPLFGTQGKDIPELERMLADLYQLRPDCLAA